MTEPRKENIQTKCMKQWVKMDDCRLFSERERLIHQIESIKDNNKKGSISHVLKLLDDYMMQKGLV